MHRSPYSTQLSSSLTTQLQQSTSQQRKQPKRPSLSMTQPVYLLPWTKAGLQLLESTSNAATAQGRSCPQGILKFKRMNLRMVGAGYSLYLPGGRTLAGATKGPRPSQAFQEQWPPASRGQGGCPYLWAQGLHLGRVWRT